MSKLFVFILAFPTDEQSEVEDIPFLGAQDVIDEVLTLLARLETERHEAHEKHLEEIERLEALKRKIDELELRKLRELPALVQRGRVQ